MVFGLITDSESELQDSHDENDRTDVCNDDNAGDRNLPQYIQKEKMIADCSGEENLGEDDYEVCINLRIVSISPLACFFILDYIYI